MNTVIITEAFCGIPFCEKEILRYAGCRSADDEVIHLMRDCIEEIRDKLKCRVCCRELTLSLRDDVCDFGCFSVKSKGLAKNLSGCESVILFAATVGIEADRLISKYGHLSPARALMLQAIGAERIEALCDAFCKSIEAKKGMGLRPRFSPGYGDLSLSVQREIFSVLECEKHIGLYLGDSLLMSPSKSVTAFVGLTPDKATETVNKCSLCDKKDCTYRGIL